MGWTIEIARRPVALSAVSDDVVEEITLDELRAALATDPDFSFNGEKVLKPRRDRNGVYKERTSYKYNFLDPLNGRPTAFSLRDGIIVVHRPDLRAGLKALEVAKRLPAQLQLDDGTEMKTESDVRLQLGESLRG